MNKFDTEFEVGSDIEFELDFGSDFGVNFDDNFVIDFEIGFVTDLGIHFVIYIDIDHEIGLWILSFLFIIKFWTFWVHVVGFIGVWGGRYSCFIAEFF